MATNESTISDALKSFDVEAADITTSALRVLAFTSLYEAREALSKGQYEGAQEAAFAFMHTCAALEKRKGSGE